MLALCVTVNWKSVKVVFLTSLTLTSYVFRLLTHD